MSDDIGAYVQVGTHLAEAANIDVIAEWHDADPQEGYWSGAYQIDTARLLVPAAIIKQWQVLFIGEADGVVDATLTLQVDGLTMEIEIDATLENGRITQCSTDLPDYVKSWLQDVINR